MRRGAFELISLFAFLLRETCRLHDLFPQEATFVEADWDSLLAGLIAQPLVTGGHPNTIEPGSAR
jgi:hypothetical protein